MGCVEDGGVSRVSCKARRKLVSNAGHWFALLLVATADCCRLDSTRPDLLYPTQSLFLWSVFRCLRSISSCNNIRSNSNSNSNNTNKKISNRNSYTTVRTLEQTIQHTTIYRSQ
mmetsp:Transcript_5514/g.12832  ORF Transcript_5514/g.12832 Transcript_5514/m.12832 type:complete len:114 (-) Transcript_5514:152-493(-)